MYVLIYFLMGLSILIAWYDTVVKNKKLDFKGNGSKFGLIFGVLTVVTIWPYYLYLLLTKYK